LHHVGTLCVVSESRCRSGGFPGDLRSRRETPRWDYRDFALRRALCRRCLRAGCGRPSRLDHPLRRGRLPEPFFWELINWRLSGAGEERWAGNFGCVALLNEGVFDSETGMNDTDYAWDANPSRRGWNWHCYNGSRSPELTYSWHALPIEYCERGICADPRWRCQIWSLMPTWGHNYATRSLRTPSPSPSPSLGKYYRSKSRIVV